MDSGAKSERRDLTRLGLTGMWAGRSLDWERRRAHCHDGPCSRQYTIHGKQDLVIIASSLNRPILALYALPEIASAEQLKGKAIASDKPGTVADYGASTVAVSAGAEAEDVDLRVIGGGGEMTAAMLSAQVHAGIAAPPHSFQLEAKGFRLLQSNILDAGSNRATLTDMSDAPEPADLAPLAARYGISPAVVEDLYARRRAGAHDAELVNLLSQPDRGGLDREQARALVDELPVR